MTQNERFTNRELSWLAFNKRVLSEAKDNHLPLMERLKFLTMAIVSVILPISMIL